MNHRLHRGSRPARARHHPADRAGDRRRPQAARARPPARRRACAGSRTPSRAGPTPSGTTTATPSRRPRSAVRPAARRSRSTARSCASAPEGARGPLYRSAMATRLKPIGHEDRLSIVEHLDELRTRVIICVVDVRRRVRHLPVAGGLRSCARVNEPLAEVANKKPCDETRDPLEQADCLAAGAEARQRADRASWRGRWRASAGDDAALRAQAERARGRGRRGGRRSPRPLAQAAVTLGVGEPLTATLIAAGYAALLLVAAAAALPGLRVRAAGVLAEGAPGRAAADGDGAVPVLRGRRLRVLPGAAGGGRLPPELQRRQLRRAAAGARLQQVRDHGAWP